MNMKTLLEDTLGCLIGLRINVMKIKLIVFSLLMVSKSLFSYSSTQMTAEWLCTFSPDDIKNKESTIRIKKSAIRIDVYSDEYSGVPVPYATISDTGEGLIATHLNLPDPDQAEKNPIGIALLLLNKSSGVFRLRSYSLRSSFEESYSGTCVSVMSEGAG